jgi:hypothetical protein
MNRDWRTLTHEEYLKLQEDGKLTPFDINDPKTKEFLIEFARKNRKDHLDSLKQNQTKV